MGFHQGRWFHWSPFYRGRGGGGGFPTFLYDSASASPQLSPSSLSLSLIHLFLCVSRTPPLSSLLLFLTHIHSHTGGCRDQWKSRSELPKSLSQTGPCAPKLGPDLCFLEPRWKRRCCSLWTFAKSKVKMRDAPASWTQRYDDSERFVGMLLRNVMLQTQKKKRRVEVILKALWYF